MSTTWSEIKLASLQKMFAAEGSTIPTDESTQDYIASMPFACNEALQLLSTAGKFLIKSVSVANFPTDNLINDTDAKAIRNISDESFTYSVKGARSYFFECSGIGTCDIYVDEDLFKQITIESDTAFASYKGLILNDEKKDVSITFKSDYPMTIKNIALYSDTFPTDERVQDYTPYLRFRMEDLAEDFYQLDNQQIYFEGADPEYLQTSDYFQEGQNVFVIPRSKVGNYTIYYKAYPTKITSGTEDDYELPVDPEVATLIPLYIASQLYKDDDNGIATSYRNEFEVAFERLSQKTNVPVAESFVSESGWI